jgi:hypothetical protein
MERNLLNRKESLIRKGLRMRKKWWQHEERGKHVERRIIGYIWHLETGLISSENQVITYNAQDTSSGYRRCTNRRKFSFSRGSMI